MRYPIPQMYKTSRTMMLVVNYAVLTNPRQPVCKQSFQVVFQLILHCYGMCQILGSRETLTWGGGGVHKKAGGPSLKRATKRAPTWKPSALYTPIYIPLDSPTKPLDGGFPKLGVPFRGSP